MPGGRQSLSRVEHAAFPLALALPPSLSLVWQACSNLPAVTKALEEAGLEEREKGDFCVFANIENISCRRGRGFIGRDLFLHLYALAAAVNELAAEPTIDRTTSAVRASDGSFHTFFQRDGALRVRLRCAVYVSATINSVDG